jgi:beta-1,4-mannosyltransferase
VPVPPQPMHSPRGWGGAAPPWHYWLRFFLSRPCEATPPSHHFQPSFLRFAAIYACLATIVWSISEVGSLSPINYYATVVWAAYLPIALIGLIGVYFVRRWTPSTYQGKVDRRVIFAIPTIARFDVAPALNRVVHSILTFAPANMTNYRIDIVLDEGAEATDQLIHRYQGLPYVRIVIVPAGYQLPNGTRYKARAAQYLTELRTRQGESREDVFVYHLDDDTAVSCDTIASIAEFIAKDAGQFHAAQGVLAFPRELATNRFCWLADAVRPADDLSRFHFFTELVRRPVTGFHGEHLLVRASIEADIGWDFGQSVKVEDAYFALTFAHRYPEQSTFLNSVSYGASPATVADLIKQRRRWAAGLFGLAFDRQFTWTSKLPLFYTIVNWAFGLFQHAAIVILAALLVGSANTSPVLRPVALIWAFNLSFILWMYLEGLRLNLDVSRRRFGYAANVLAIIPALLGISLVEAWAAFLGFCDFVTKKQGFEVIAKRT